MHKLLNNRVLSSFYTLAGLLSLNWFLPIFDSLLAETSTYARVELMIYLAVIVSLEFLALLLVQKLYKGPGASRIYAVLLAFLMTANLLGLLLSFHDPFLTQNKLVKATEFLLMASVFYWLCSNLAKKPFIIGGLSLLYMAVVSQQIIGLIIKDDVPQASSAFGQFKTVKFENKPNVYILSYDALIPPAIASEYLGLEKLDYVSVLEEYNGRFFKNTFSDGDATQNSLNTVLYLDPAIWAGMGRNRDMAFSGIAPSPVFDIFRSNGYKINTAFSGKYLLQGKYIDAFTSHRTSESYCKFALPWYYLQHLGYCSVKINVINKMFPRSDGDHIGFEEQLIDNFEKRFGASQPWLSFIYIISPGHTPRNYTHTPQEQIRFKKRFTVGQTDAADHLRSLMALISANDPKGIILVFGDHGAWLSRALKLDNKGAGFILKDRHAVLSSIYPGDACSAYMGPVASDHFVTPSRLVRQLITCLSGGIDPIDWEVDYSGPYGGYSFGDFIYE